MPLRRFGTVLFLLSHSVALPQNVTVQDGSIVYHDRDGATHRITESGRNSEPTLSADGQRVVFVRALGAAPGVGVPEIVVTEVWIASVRPPSTPRRAYRGAMTMPNGSRSEAFWTPRFSPDNRYVYFLSDFSATSNALCRLDLATGTARFLTPGVTDYAVLNSGRWQGFLIVSVRSLSEPDTDGIRFPIYPYYLLNAEGRILTRVANEDAKLEQVVEKHLHGNVAGDRH